MQKKVLFVCTGNTCRSPMAEGFFAKGIAHSEGVECIGSAGVAAFSGDEMSAETEAVLAEKNAELEGFRSRQVREELLEQATHVFAMTRSHLSALQRGFPDQHGKCYLIGDVLKGDQQAGMDVPDPIGMGPQAYRSVAQVLEQAVPEILKFIENESQT